MPRVIHKGRLEKRGVWGPEKTGQGGDGVRRSGTSEIKKYLDFHFT